MNTQVDHQLSVHRVVDVPLSTARAFELFTDRMAAFWPATHSIGTSPIAEVRIEPQVGGRWYEVGVDGSECTWGRVAAWDPPERVVLVWQVAADWTYDPALETEVEVTFIEQDAGRTRVEVTHRGIENYGDRAAEMHAVYGSDSGWGGILGRLAAAAAR